MKVTFRGVGLACASLFLFTVHAQAQLAPGASSLKLVNLDTNEILSSGAWAFRGDVRLFGSDEKIAYGTGELSRGLSNGLSVTLRGTAARYLNFTGPVTIRHGGNDLELLFKYSQPDGAGLMLAGGLALPHTPAQNKLFGTGEVIYRYPTRMADVYLGAKGVFNDTTSLAALCAGIDSKLASSFKIVADVSAPVIGNNTFNTTTGAQERKLVYGAALRFAPFGMGRGNVSLDLGVTNGLGGTTGMSLSPALGNSVGGFAALTVRY